MSFLSKSTVLLLFVLCCTSFTSTEAYDALDPNGNITIKWDVVNWTPDGYVAVVTIYNYQQYRHIEAPGWLLGWTWANNEVIWSIFGGQTTEQGNCSRFKGNIPRCCKKSPTVVDLSPRTPHNQKIANCCKGGLISSMVQDPANAASSFQLSVGSAGNTNKTVRIPKNITLNTPGPGYTCGPAKIVRPSKFLSADKRRITQALMTWNITCTYSHFLTHKAPTCCVSLSSFNNKAIAPCPASSCGRRKNNTVSRGCVDPKSPHVPGHKNIITPLVQCTSHMCPIKIQWHLKLNYKDYWRVTIRITNLNYHMNYTQWNLIVQHPNFDNLTQVFGSKYEALTSLSTTNDTAMLWGIKHYNDVLMQAGRYGKVHLELLFRKDKATFTSKKHPNFDNLTQVFGSKYEALTSLSTTNDTAMLWGIKHYNDVLMQAGRYGKVHLELLFRKDKATFTSKKGWAFPQRIYFNGDSCVLPPPDAYPLVA